jgi:hypothetical protein
MHSPREGAASDSYAAGIPGHINDIRGRWKSEKLKKRYCRPLEKDWIEIVRHKTSKLHR